MAPVTILVLLCILGLALAGWLLSRVVVSLLTQSWGRFSQSRRFRGTLSLLEPFHHRLKRRYPGVMSFLRRRLDVSRFRGLPLTLFILAATYVAFLLGDLVADLYEVEEMPWDPLINRALEPIRTRGLIIFFSWITALGSSATLVAVSFTATGFLWALNWKKPILPMWLTILGSQIVTWLGKYAIDRPRPEFLTDVTEFAPSFPSGHATGAAAVYGFIAYLLLRRAATTRQRFELVYWTVFLVLLIGFSRIFLSVHYVSDVAAGLLVGCFWLLAGIALTERSGGRSA